MDISLPSFKFYGKTMFEFENKTMYVGIVCNSERVYRKTIFLQLNLNFTLFCMVVFTTSLVVFSVYTCFLCFLNEAFTFLSVLRYFCINFLFKLILFNGQIKQTPFIRRI